MSRTATPLMRTLASSSTRHVATTQVNAQRAFSKKRVPSKKAGKAELGITVPKPSKASTATAPVRVHALDHMSGDTSSVDRLVLRGIPGFLHKPKMDTLCQWQTGLWLRLQSEVRNHPELLEVKQKWDRSGLDITHLLSHSAREPSLSMAFNYASNLLNNSFFLENLNPGPVQEVPAHYKRLEDKVAAYAEGIVGGGWLWLVRTGGELNDLDIMPTFAAGTMLVSNRAQRGREEVPAFGTPATSSALPTPEPVWNKELNKLIPGEPHVWDEESRELQKFTATGSYRAASAKSPSGNAGSEAAAPSSTAIQPAFVPASSRLTGRLNNIGTSGYPAPLAVLNLYEHAYLGSQYNVWGRKKYAANWWKHLDWNKIGRRSSQLG